MALPTVIITSEMIEAATSFIPNTEVKRTKASSIDTLTGHLGEMVFAQYMFGDWRKNFIGKNKGESDFGDFEIKTSAFPFNLKLNLLVREDYAKKRKPRFYVQIIIDVSDAKADTIPVNTKAILCGFATAKEVDSAPLRDFGSKLGAQGGYRCHYILIGQLQPVEYLKDQS